MNPFLQLSIDYAQQRSYLDDLYSIYQTIPNGIRDIDQKIWEQVEKAYHAHNAEALISNLLKLQLFPIKDSYVAFLKRDKAAIKRNPLTTNRLASEVIELGLDKIYEKCSLPKETNRQIGTMFKNWIKRGTLGFPILQIDDFVASTGNAILDASDSAMKSFAQEHLSYHNPKGLDFVARVKGKYIIGEAKFLTDFGGHQNAQFNDAITTLHCEANAIKVAILDGVLYIKGKNKMYKNITQDFPSENIMSALLLRNFLYAL